jgi:hypothetical protein
MANKIKPKRSYTASSVPLTTDLESHELAINWADGKAFTKNAAGNIVSVTLGGGSYTLPAATTSSLGGVIVGTGLSVSSGTVSAAVSSVAGRTGAVTLTSADVSGVIPSTTTGITGAAAITNIVSLTAAQYAALGTKNSSTLYIVSG